MRAFHRYGFIIVAAWMTVGIVYRAFYGGNTIFPAALLVAALVALREDLRARRRTQPAAQS